MSWASNSALPQPVVDALPLAAQSVFRSAANAAMFRGCDELHATRQAWSIVKSAWRPGKTQWVRKLKTSTLYVRRNLENAADLVKWAKDSGFPTTQLPAEMHVTIAYSKTEVAWPEGHTALVTIVSPANRALARLGDGSAVVLKFETPDLTARWQQLIDKGASWKYPDYTPHVTVSWEVPGEVDLAKIEPYRGPLQFGPEIFAEVDEGWRDTHVEKRILKVENQHAARGFLSFTEALNKVGARHTRKEFEQIQTIHDTSIELGAACAHDNVVDDEVEKLEAKVCKIDDELGIVFGWAMVCKIGKKEYFDTQGDHITEPAMLKASTEFMLSDRVMKEMHVGDQKGTIVFAFPMTAEISKAMGCRAKYTGLMIGMKPDTPEVLAKFKSGEYTGFSIGGSRIEEKDEV